MSIEDGRGRAAKAAVLMLRLSLAGVLCYSGVRNLNLPPEPVRADATDVQSPAEELAAAVAAPAGADTATAVVDQSGVTLYAGWPTLTGVVELILSGLLLVGFLTRLVGLGLLGGVVYAATGSGWMTQTTDWWAQPVRLIQTQETAVLLLGAMALSLLVAGYGCLGVDGLLFKRKRLNQSIEAAASE